MSVDAAIASLVSRLETVVSRLESVEKQLASGAPTSSASASGASSASGGNGGDSPFVREYDDLIQQYITPLVETTKKLGDEVTTRQVTLLQQAIQAQRSVLAVAATSKKPADPTALFKPTNDLLAEITEIKEKNRASKFFNNLSAVAEGVGALQWVAVSPAPGPFVGEMRGGSEFYSNRLLKEFKGNNQDQVDWVNHLNGFLKALQPYIKTHHTTGLAWNPRGGDAPASAPASAAPAAAPAAKPAAASAAPEKKADNSGLFAALSKGTDVTGGLKKVTDDMKTKNRAASEKSSVVPAAPAKGAAASSGAKAAVPNKPAKTALEGNKWTVEYHNGNREIVIEITEAKQSVYIYKCLNSTVLIKGKCNSIAIDDCTKTAVVFDNVVAVMEAVNCKSIEVQVTGSVPAIAIDKTSGCQLYLSASSLGTEIVTSKSSEMNVLIPGAKPEDDMTELAVPEQYKTIVKGQKLVTETVQHV